MTVLQAPRVANHVRHLIRNILQPTLNALRASNHAGDLGTNDCLGNEWFSKRLALRSPFQAFLNDGPLTSG